MLIFILILFGGKKKCNTQNKLFKKRKGRLNVTPCQSHVCDIKLEASHTHTHTLLGYFVVGTFN